LAADRMHGDDVFMAQVRRGQRLVLETLELAGIDGCRERQDFESDTPPKRDLLRFVDHAHAAAAHFTEQTEVAELPDVLRGIVRARAADDFPGSLSSAGPLGVRQFIPALRQSTRRKRE